MVDAALGGRGGGMDAVLLAKNIARFAVLLAYLERISYCGLIIYSYITCPL